MSDSDRDSDSDVQVSLFIIRRANGRVTPRVPSHQTTKHHPRVAEQQTRRISHPSLGRKKRDRDMQRQSHVLRKFKMFEKIILSYYGIQYITQYIIQLNHFLY